MNQYQAMKQKYMDESKRLNDCPVRRKDLSKVTASAPTQNVRTSKKIHLHTVAAFKFGLFRPFRSFSNSGGNIKKKSKGTRRCLANLTIGETKKKEKKQSRVQDCSPSSVSLSLSLFSFYLS